MDKYNLYKQYIKAKNGAVIDPDLIEMSKDKELSDSEKEILDKAKLDFQIKNEMNDLIEAPEKFDFKPKKQEEVMSVEPKKSVMQNLEEYAKEKQKEEAKHAYKDTEAQIEDFVPEEKKIVEENKEEKELPKEKSTEELYKESLTRYLDLMNKKPERNGTADWINALGKISEMRAQATNNQVIKVPLIEDYNEKELEKAGKQVEILGKLQKEKPKVKTRIVTEGVERYEIKEDEYGNELSKRHLGKSESFLNNQYYDKRLNESISAADKRQEKSILAADERQEKTINRLEVRDKIKDGKDFNRRLTVATKEATISPIYKNATQTLLTSQTLKSLLDDAFKNGGQSVAMLGPLVAKGIAKEVGAMTEGDVTRYVSDPKLANKYYSSWKKMTEGKISQSDRDNLLRLINIMEESEKKNLILHLNYEKERFAAREGLDVDEIKDIHFGHPLLNNQVNKLKTPTEEQISKYIEMYPNIDREKAKSILTERLNK